MSTLREQIDNLDPEKYARDALASARSAKQRADALGLPLPESVRKLLEIPESELARRRAKAIETAGQASSRESRPAPGYPADRGADRVQESNLNFAPAPNPESTRSRRSSVPEFAWTYPSVVDIIAHPSNYDGLNISRSNEDIFPLQWDRIHDAIDTARAVSKLTGPDFLLGSHTYMKRMMPWPISPRYAVPNPVSLDFQESLRKYWPSSLSDARKSASGINKGDTLLIVFAKYDHEESDSTYTFYANVIDHAKIGDDEEEFVVENSGHEIHVLLHDPNLRAIRVVANSINRTIPK